MALHKPRSIEAGLQMLSSVEKQATTQQPKLSLREKMKIVLTNITVEPIMFCYVLPNVMGSLATQNLNLEKACRVDLGYSISVCDAMAIRNTSGYTEQEEVVVQKLVASVMAWKNVVRCLIPAILLLFLGSWSDRHNKRKPCILLPMFGEIITTTGFLICTYYFYELSLIYVVIADIAPALTGGSVSMFMGLFSYISSMSTVETRTVRLGAVNMLDNVSLTIGIALSGILYTELGFYGVFLLSMVMYIAGMIYGYWRVQEIKLDEPIPDVLDKNGKKKGFLRDFFDMKHIMETFKVTFKEGARNRKQRIAAIMILVMVIIGPSFGEMNVLYLFVRYKFNWNEIDYSVYSTFNCVVCTIAILFSLLYFSKYLQLDDSLLGLISCTSKIASSFIYAFAPTPFVFYIGALVEALNGTSMIAMRSMISKLVPPEELGSIYSIFGVSEALIPLIYGPMYSFIYRNTINTFPGAFYLAGGGLTLPAVLIFLWLYREHKRDEREDQKLKEQEESLLLNGKEKIIL